MPSEMKFEIKETLATISEEKGGWAKELNVIAWNDSEPKYDIRPWTAGHEKMGKGITLTREECVNLMKALQNCLAKD